jgi:ubiquinone/menaquinone biosynthesis C-methylase UbiE
MSVEPIHSHSHPHEPHHPVALQTEAGMPPQVAIFQIINGMWVTQIASAVAQLGIADFIAAGTRRVDHLAEECSADAGALYRLLRAAQTIGLCRETAPKEFALTPVGETLRSAVPGSMRDIVLAETAAGHWLPWGRLADSVRSGKPMTNETLGMSVWEYYAQNPEEGQCFARGMSNLSSVAATEVAAVYNVGEAKRVVDVGGSEGVLLRGLLRGAPRARGVLFDRPDIIAYAQNAIDASEFAGRIELAGGDFFHEVPSGGDVYLLKHVLHDWNDSECETILRNVHRAAAPGTKLVLVEMLLPDEPQPSPVTLMDMNMMVMVGGRERTQDEYRALLATCGYELERVIPTTGMFFVLEATRK